MEDYTQKRQELLEEIARAKEAYEQHEKEYWADHCKKLEDIKKDLEGRLRRTEKMLDHAKRMLEYTEEPPKRRKFRVKVPESYNTLPSLGMS